MTNLITCPRPPNAFDLLEEYTGTWVTPRGGSKLVVSEEGLVETYRDAAFHRARLSSDDKLTLHEDGEATTYVRIANSGTPGKLAGAWGESEEAPPKMVFEEGEFRLRAVGSKLFLGGRYAATAPDSDGSFRLETWVYSSEWWLVDERLHSYAWDGSTNACTEKSFDVRFSHGGRRLTLSNQGVPELVLSRPGTPCAELGADAPDTLYRVHSVVLCQEYSPEEAPDLRVQAEVTLERTSEPDKGASPDQVYLKLCGDGGAFPASPPWPCFFLRSSFLPLLTPGRALRVECAADAGKVRSVELL